MNVIHRSFNRRDRRRDSFARFLTNSAAAALLATTVHAASPRVVITPATGFAVTWDGNNGGFNNPNPGAGPADNVALASHGTTAFGSTEFGAGVHLIANINDGLYGNSHSWIANFTIPDPAPFVGLSFASGVNISSIAWGRDNGDTTGDACGGTCMDRNVGTYTWQYTTVPNPDGNTADTGDAATGWANLVTVQYLPGADDPNFTGYLRHRFDISLEGSPVAATGIRCQVSDPNICIDEIEVNPPADPVPPISNFIEITPAAGFGIAWNRNEGLFSTPASPAPAPVNDASVSRGATAFGSSEVNLGVHFIHNVNDGLYGNAHSWIPKFTAPADPAPYIGINFGRCIFLSNLAWGRDNGDVAGDCCGGTLTDRTLGVYVIEVTTAPNPGLSTPDACGPYSDGGWVTIGTLNYKANDPTYFNSYLRHRFDVSQGGSPIAATGLRIKVPNANSDIDEIEVNGNIAIEENAIRITNTAGFTTTWDGNDGQFNDPASGAAPPPNAALASNGAIPIGSSELAYLGIKHFITNINDGLYGNEKSWISANGIGGNTDPDPWIGVVFPSRIGITNIAWGRDNGDNTPTDPGCGGLCGDRALGGYRLQYTTVEAPDATTPETGDDTTGWADVGSVTYASASPPFFTPYLRHRFDIAAGGAPLEATAIRIKVSSGSLDLDEIEVNTPVTAPPAPGPVGLTSAAGYQISWDGNNGQFNNPAAGAAPPANPALASQGTTPFTSSDLGAVLEIPYHRAVNLNDGLYGNAHSWISANGVGGNSDPDPFAGLAFSDTINVTNIAWSRDNGDAGEGTVTDRSLGTYTVQVTTVASPDATTPDTGDPVTGWATVGAVQYRRADPPGFTPYLRHRFEVSSGGAPIEATGIRIKVSDGLIALDEIEVNTAASLPPPELEITLSGGNAVITWTGGGGLESAPSVTGPWVCLPDAVPGYSVPVNSGSARFYRTRR